MEWNCNTYCDNFTKLIINSEWQSNPYCSNWTSYYNSGGSILAQRQKFMEVLNNVCLI